MILKIFKSLSNYSKQYLVMSFKYVINKINGKFVSGNIVNN